MTTIAFLCAGRLHLAVNPGLYSMEDLIGVKNGSLLDFLEEVGSTHLSPQTSHNARPRIIIQQIAKQITSDPLSMNYWRRKLFWPSESLNDSQLTPRYFFDSTCSFATKPSIWGGQLKFVPFEETNRVTREPCEALTAVHAGQASKSIGSGQRLRHSLFLHEVVGMSYPHESRSIRQGFAAGTRLGGEDLFHRDPSPLPREAKFRG